MHFITFYFRKDEGEYRNVNLEVRVGDTDEGQAERQNAVAGNLGYDAAFRKIVDVSMTVVP